MLCLAAMSCNRSADHSSEGAIGAASRDVAQETSALVAASVPPSRGGRDMLGQPLPLDGVRWINTPDHEAVAVEGKVTLVRWWTDTCPYCAGSLPAIDALSRANAERGFQTIAVYHPKPPRHVDPADALDTAKRLGYQGAVAIDRDWAVLDRLYLSKGNREATSVSFLLDRQGIVRHVHPGPEFRPTDDPAEKRLNDDFEAIQSAIETLLAK